MLDHANRNGAQAIPDKLKAALGTLLEASSYADITASDRWDFAVEIECLQELGLSTSDLRWLVRMRYVEHARELTLEGDDGRAFRPTGDLTFCERTCFVLTEIGISNARRLAQARETMRANTRPPEPPTAADENGDSFRRAVIHWDAAARKLRMNGELVKRFKWPAANQEIVLNAFQEEGWPERIDDPLPPHADQDSKRRLSDTIKCLNRKQANPLIHFHGDGTGEGVIWELVQPDRKR